MIDIVTNIGLICMTVVIVCCTIFLCGQMFFSAKDFFEDRRKSRIRHKKIFGED